MHTKKKKVHKSKKCTVHNSYKCKTMHIQTHAVHHQDTLFIVDMPSKRTEFDLNRRMQTNVRDINSFHLVFGLISPSSNFNFVAPSSSLALPLLLTSVHDPQLLFSHFLVFVPILLYFLYFSAHMNTCGSMQFKNRHTAETVLRLRFFSFYLPLFQCFAIHTEKMCYIYKDWNSDIFAMRIKFAVFVVN